MLYSGAKGTMTPNNRLQRTALPRHRVPPLSAIERSIYRSCLDGKSRYSCSNGGRNYFVRMTSLPGLPAIEPL
jgi:hypothetical protein